MQFGIWRTAWSHPKSFAAEANLTRSVATARLDLPPLEVGDAGETLAVSETSGSREVATIDDLVALLASDPNALKSSVDEFLDRLEDLGRRIAEVLPDHGTIAFLFAALSLAGAFAVVRREAQNDPEAAADLLISPEIAGA